MALSAVGQVILVERNFKDSCFSAYWDCIYNKTTFALAIMWVLLLVRQQNYFMDYYIFYICW
jgi:hypothetical protein